MAGLAARVGGGRALSAAFVAAAAGAGAFFVLAAYFTSPLLALGLLAGAALLAAVLVDPLTGVAAGLLLVPLEPMNVQAGAAGLTLSEALFFAAAGSAVLHMVTTRPARIGAVHVSFGVLLAVAATGLLFAADQEVVRKIVPSWALLLVLSVYVAGADPLQVRRLVMVVVASCGALALLALAGAGEIELRNGGTEAAGRVTGAFNHPNLLAAYLGLGLPLTLVMAVQARGAWRAAATVAAAATALALLLTLSRAATIAAAASLVVLLAWPSFRRIAVIGGVIVLLTAPVGLSPLLASRDAALIRARLGTIQEERGTNPRLRIYTQAPQMIADRPLLGFGIGNFAVWSPIYGMRDKGGDVFQHAHNVALTIAVETGLLGLAAFLAFAWRIGILSSRVVRARGAPLHGIGVGVAAALAGAAVLSLSDYPLRSNPVMALLMIEVGLLVAIAAAIGRPLPGVRRRMW